MKIRNSAPDARPVLIPAGTFHGGDEVPPGTFHGGDEVPPGTFHAPGDEAPVR